MKTGGRKKGTPNKRTQAFDQLAAAVAQTVPDAFHGNAHALLMSIYKDPKHPLQIRMDAAKAAISFETPRLAAIEHKPAELDLSKLTDEQLGELDRLLSCATENPREGSMSPDKEIRKYHACEAESVLVRVAHVAAPTSSRQAGARN